MAAVRAGPGVALAGGISVSMHSAAMAERLFDCAHDTLFFVKNCEARYVAVNRGLVDRVGRRDKRELLGRTAEELFPAPYGSDYYAQDCAVLDGSAEIHDRLQRLPLADGAAAWCISYKFPIVENGKIVGLCGICRAVDPADDGIAQVARAVDYMQQHYGEAIRIDALARIAGLGTRRLERLVKRLFELTPMQLLARTRIEAASKLLTRGDDSIAAVASCCGYADQSAFSRQFKALTGTTPMRYREAGRGAPG